MPGHARRHQLKRSLIYHVYNRGNLKLEIFHSDQDCNHYLNLTKEYIYSFGVKMYHWVLMPNHYHFLLEIEKPENLSSMMAGLSRAYTHYYHSTYDTAGYLWQGRFKSQPIEEGRYLIACGRYIERNPVRAGIVSEASEYRYSSANFYCKAKPDNITTESPAFCEFGEDIFRRQNAYRKFLTEFNPEEERVFEDFENPLGSQEFVRRLIKVNGRYIPRRKGRIPSGH